MLRRALSLLVLLAALPIAVNAEEPISPDRPIQSVVDHYIQRKLAAEKITPAPRASDATLIRRLSLDLAGRIPAAVESQEYVASEDPAKVEALVDRLIASPGFVRHQVSEFDTLLMHGSGGSLKNYLTQAFTENRSWDQIFREILLADENDKERQDVDEFLKRRVKDLDRLTNDVSVKFFGVNVSCAQCHDHPLVDDWKQNHFFGMKSFFNRSFENGGFVGERNYGLVKFKTVAGDEHTAKLMFLSGTVLSEPENQEPDNATQKKESELLKKLAKDKQAPPAPEFSRRAQLINVALKEGENRFFARSIVNRIWYRLFGFGLVMPVDQLHSSNPASHPELLDWLAEDLITHGYDLRRLIRGLVQSEAYARSSRWDGDERPYQAHFAVGNVRVLTPTQYGASLKLAATDPDQFAASKKPEDLEKRIDGTANSGMGLANQFDVPVSDYFQIDVAEALLLSNNKGLVDDLLSDGGGRLVGRLKQLEAPQEIVETAYWNILGRIPDDEEIQVLAAYLEERQDRRVEACRQLVWALLTGSEFRFNH